MDITEKKELILRSFKEAFNKEMAYLKCGVTEEERKILDADSEFQNRLQYVLIEERERIVKKLQSLSQSENEQIAYKAILSLGEILYPEMFDAIKDPAVKININNLTKEEEERINNEYGLLLSGKGLYSKNRATQ